MRQTGKRGIRDLPGVTGWSGPVEILAQSWDSDPQAWNSDITTWNEADTGFQPKRIVFAGGNQGLIQQGKTNDQLTPGGAGVTHPMVAYAQRGGVDFDDYGQRKTISGAIPRVQGNSGTAMQFQFGAQESDNASVDMTPLLPYVIGVDDRLDFFIDGRLMFQAVSSTGGAPWKYAGYYPEVRKSGRW